MAASTTRTWLKHAALGAAVALASLAMPAPAAAQAGPTLSVQITYDSIQGYDFASDATVMVQLYSGFGGTLLWSGTAPTFGGGSFSIDRMRHGQDLTPGMFVQATDGNAAKVMTLAPLSIGAVNRAADTVAGTAGPGARVTVGAFDPGGGGTAVQVDADGSTGAWLASLAGSYDIGPLTNVWATVADGDGDRTQADRSPPMIQANLVFDTVGGQWFAPNSSVSVSVGGWTGLAPTDGNGNFMVDRSTHGQDVAPGTVVSATDGVDAKSLTADALAITSIDVAADHVSGDAPAGAWVNVGAWNPQGGENAFVPGVQANGSGQWTADFGGVGFDVRPTTHVNAGTTDADGDATQVDGELPRIQADIASDQVRGTWFDRSSVVQVSMPGFAGTAPTDQQGNFFIDRWHHNVDLVAGTTVNVSDAHAAKALTLDGALAIGSVDSLYDVVSGTAQPGAEVGVNVFNPFLGTGSGATATATGAGVWSADFHGTFDVTDGTHVTAWAADADGDATEVSRVPASFQSDIDGDSVNGNNFARSASVTVTVYDAPLPGGQTVAAASAPTDADGNFGMDSAQLGADLQPGMFVTVADGATTKSLHLVGVSVDAIDLAADSVSGTAPPGANVSVGVGDQSGGEGREVTADGSGHWTATFTDILPTYGVNAQVRDDDGDSTSASRQPAQIEASITYDSVNGNGFARNAEVTVTVDGNPVATVPTDSWGSFWVEQFGVDLVPGSSVSATDGSTTKDVTLVAVTLDAVDPAADTVAGTAPVGAVVGVGVWSGMDEGAWLDTTAGDGTWAVDFTGVYDIGGMWQASAQVRDADGDSTSAGRQTPVLEAHLAWSNINGEGFAPMTPVAVTLYDASDGVLWSAPVATDGAGRFDVDQQAFHADLLPGMRITADDGHIAKELRLAAVAVTGVDRQADVATGTAPAGALVEVGAWDVDNGTSITVTASGAGAWTADFTGLFDIAGGTGVGATVADADGDRTTADREPPTLDASLTYDYVGGSGFAAGSTVGVTVYASGGAQVLATSASADNGEFGVDLSAVGLSPGMRIVADDGTDAKELTLADMRITSVDPATDIVSGTAPSGSRVGVDVWDGSQNAWIDAAAGAGGTWTADFTGRVDLTASAHANAGVEDEDRDRTSWDRSATSLVGNLTADRVHGEGFASDGSAAVEINGVPVAGPVPTRADGSFDFEPGVDLVPGMVVHATSPGADRTLELAAVAITALDTAADTVSGTAPPGAQVLVGVGAWESGTEQYATADGSGAWVADFTGQFDVDAATSASAQVLDGDGDRTMAEQRPPVCVLDGTTLVIAADQEATVRRSGTSIVVLGPGGALPGCGGATVANVDAIVRPGGGAPFTIDLSGGAFAPGATSEGKSSEIEFNVDGALVIEGSAAADLITIGANGVNLNNDADVDVTGNWSQVTVNGAGGNDVVSAAGGGPTGGAFAGPVVLDGGAGNDVLTGGSGADRLAGGGGRDVLSGRQGVNQLDGGVDIDRVVYSWSSAGVVVDLATGSASGAVVDDTLAAVEDVVGSSGADTLIGSLGANVLEGGAGNDAIDARDGINGNDSVNGGAGTDSCLADPRDRVKACEA